MTTPINPTPATATPLPESRWCDGCQNYVAQVKSRSGEYLCGQGHNATAQLEREKQMLADVEAAARMFLEMDGEQRARYFAVLVDLLRLAKQDLLNAIGRSDF